METPLGAYPPLEHLIVTSGSVGEGMHRFAQHAQLAGAPLRIEIFEDETPIRVVMESAPFSVFLTVLHLRREAAGTLRPEYVSLREAPDDIAAAEEALACPVRIGSWSGFALSREAWRLPMRRRDPVLQGVLERHAAEVLARLPQRTDVVSELRRTLATRIARGDVRLATVARALGSSVRTLQRRLEEAGSSYQEVLEQARCDAAERHLGETALSIAEISWLVGYSEPSAFQRAFKRWRGQSPRSFRDGLRARGPQ
jgi:AraC-like DNA-binding protein